MAELPNNCHKSQRLAVHSAKMSFKKFLYRELVVVGYTPNQWKKAHHLAHRIWMGARS